tara:strand:- start:3151 stop:4212 length:1062 start_codon:yes stop_codon:yes gene_type:complete
MTRTTRTTNRLHFSDLDPLRFEDLCLNLVTRLDNWREINHFGRKGSDGGVDIFAIRRENDIDQIWFIQCKRYLKISKADLTEIVDKVLTNPSPPDKLLVIVSCDVSRTLFQYLKDYSKKQGISETELWTASTLEAKLYKDYNDLLFVYFGLRIENKVKDNVARIKHSLRMEKRVLKELIDHKYIKETNDFKLFLYNPSARFISSKVYVRSVDDTTYPNCEETPSGQISPWFRTFFYNTYHNGLEFCLDAGMGTIVIMDTNGNWEPITDYYDKRKKDPKYRVIRAKEIGRIPYYNIVDFKTDGDEYTSEPHLFCKFYNDGMPYEEIYYKSNGDPKREIADWEFDREKRTTFLKE